MVCLKCSHCCFWFDVHIIKPEYFDDIINEEDITKEKTILKPEKVFCPYLKRKDNQFYCIIHHYPWFKYTPCYSFIQIEENDKTNCRIGDWYFNDPCGIEYYQSYLMEKWEKYNDDKSD